MYWIYTPFFHWLKVLNLSFLVILLDFWLANSLEFVVFKVAFQVLFIL
jgi:hypothetical protein